MATTLFPTSTVSTATLTSHWAAGATKRLLSLTRGGAAVTQTDNTIASLGTSEATAQSWGSTTNNLSGVTGLTWITNPLNAVTISGNISYNIRALESNTMANYGLFVGVYRIPSGGGAETTFASMSQTVELGTVQAAFTETSAPITSPAFAAGDRLAINIFWLPGAGAGATASGFTVSGFYNGPTGGASGDTFITFTETITEQTATKAFPFAARTARNTLLRR